MANSINWYESAALDAAHLNSPQPCPRGVHCDYKIMDPTTNTLIPGCCRGVHPGEEGNGRRIFAARTMDDGRKQPECVRLTGMAGFYERRRRKMSWSQWCTDKGIPFTPALPGKPFEPVVRVPIGKGKKGPMEGRAGMRSRGVAEAVEAAISCQDLEASLREALMVALSSAARGGGGSSPALKPSDEVAMAEARNVAALRVVPPPSLNLAAAVREQSGCGGCACMPPMVGEMRSPGLCTPPTTLQAAKDIEYEEQD